jgi:hypothetical protein
MIGSAHHERETIVGQAEILKRAKHQIATLDLVLGSDRRRHSNMMANLRQNHEHSDGIDLDHRRPEQAGRLQEGLGHLADRPLSAYCEIPLSSGRDGILEPRALARHCRGCDIEAAAGLPDREIFRNRAELTSEG